MENKSFSVESAKNPIIKMHVTSGHFTTGKDHISHYLNVSTLKSNAMVARDVARELAIPYISSTIVETIVCMENTKVIGAYIAEELLQDGMSVVNRDGDINVVTPINNTQGKLTFYDNELDWIKNKNILLLMATISSGGTVRKALECLEYYGGRLAGISTLFMASQEKMEHEIYALFTSEDIPGYKVDKTADCEMCKAGEKLDAIISSEGYSKI